MMYRIFLILLSLNIAQAAFTKDSITIYYDNAYNIVPPFLLIFLKYLHPFDGEKYRKVFEDLQKSEYKVSVEFKRPAHIVSENDLLLVHSKHYLDSLQHMENILRIAEIPTSGVKRKLPPFIYQWILDTFSGTFHTMIVTPMQWATQGTIEGAKEAIESGKSVINLGGGFHHAKRDSGEGFCVLSDIVLACKKIWETKPNAKILVIDLDNHQGNGVAFYREIDAQVNENMSIFDIYAKDGYPFDKHERAKYINFPYPVEKGLETEEYLTLLHKNLTSVLNNQKFDLIIYNAGTDIFEKDPLRGMNVTKEGIIVRDEFVFASAKEHEIPVCMVLSGGYTQESWQIIAESIKNIIKKLFS